MNGHLSALFDGLLNVVDAASGGITNPRSVNLIGDWSHETSRQIRQVLANVGLSVNMSFSVNDRNARVEDLRRLNGAPLTLMSSYNPNLAAHREASPGTVRHRTLFPILPQGVSRDGVLAR